MATKKKETTKKPKRKAKKEIKKNLVNRSPKNIKKNKKVGVAKKKLRKPVKKIS